jgi:hypothetical protein
MGIGQVDAIVSHATAFAIGIPSRNALLISTPHTDLDKLQQRLKKILPPTPNRPSWNRGSRGRRPRGALRTAG